MNDFPTECLSGLPTSLSESFFFSRPRPDGFVSVGAVGRKFKFVSNVPKKVVVSNQLRVLENVVFFHEE